MEAQAERDAEQQRLAHGPGEAGEMPTQEKDYTLCFVRRTVPAAGTDGKDGEDENGEGEGGAVTKQVLLGMKKRGFGCGKINGFGGKVEKGESYEEAARRELQEECGLVAGAMDRRGMLVFTFEDMPQTLKVHVFVTSDYTGEVTESDEMRPQWYAEEEIPYDTMWADDRHWVPLLLQGKSLMGRFHFEDEDTLLEHDVHEI